nr:MAG TPA: hypothetical protein [Caudoviricetes sp.]
MSEDFLLFCSRVSRISRYTAVAVIFDFVLRNLDHFIIFITTIEE